MDPAAPQASEPSQPITSAPMGEVSSGPDNDTYISNPAALIKPSYQVLKVRR